MELKDKYNITWFFKYGRGNLINEMDYYIVFLIIFRKLT